jgi:hypothetical protein
MEDIQYACSIMGTYTQSRKDTYKYCRDNRLRRWVPQESADQIGDLLEKQEKTNTLSQHYNSDQCQENGF